MTDMNGRGPLSFSTAQLSTSEDEARRPLAGRHMEDNDADLRLPLASEQITVEKSPVVLGTVHVHKGVQTVEEELVVPVYREEAVIEHLAPDRYDATAPVPDNEMIIPIVEERLVVTKRSVVKSYMRIRKTVSTEERDVRETLRRTVVTTTEHSLGDRQTPLRRELTT